MINLEQSAPIASLPRPQSAEYLCRPDSPPTSVIYGPVWSWRVGLSLGVDLLQVNSICSFRCVYCQLGRINVQTLERRIYVPTERVMAELRQTDLWRAVDVVTLSGNGEPTLAANLGEAIVGIKEITGKPVTVFTNATTLNDPQVRRELSHADKVCCKLDAIDERSFAKINRPLDETTLQSVIRGIIAFREEYTGNLALQIMLLHTSPMLPASLARIINEIRPEEVQLNTPLRPVPRRWRADARAGLAMKDAPGALQLSTITREDAARIETVLRRLTETNVISVYKNETDKRVLDVKATQS